MIRYFLHKGRYIFWFLLSVSFFCVAQHAEKKPSVLNLASDSQADSLVIIYSANLNGNIDNCGCGEPPLGGLDHMAGILKRERERQHTLFFDGGDAFNAYSYPALNKALVQIYRYLKPEVLTVADQEFSEGADFLGAALKGMEQAVLMGNTRAEIALPGPSYKIFRHKDMRLGITSFVELNIRQKGVALTRAPARFDAAVRAIKKTDIRALIYHGRRKNLPRLLEKYPHWDIIMLAHEQIALNERAEGRWLVCPGADGEYVSRIVLIKNKNGLTIKTGQLPVSLEWPADEKISRIIKNYQK